MKKIKVSGEQMARMVLACVGLCEIIDIDINGKETVKWCARLSGRNR